MDTIIKKVNNISFKYTICKLCRKKFNKIHNFCYKCSKQVSYHLETI